MESTRAITDMILKEAEKSAKLILQDAKKMSENILKTQKQKGFQKASEVSKILLKKAESEAELNKLNTIANSKIKANWVILSKKETWIDKVLKEAKNQLKILTKSEKYLPILEKLITEAGVILGGKELYVSLNNQDSALPLKLDDIAQKITDRTGFETKLRLSKEKPEVTGGAIVRTANGKVIMDNTFDDILLRREEELRSEIAKILF
ncbi:MAG: V-type ATP synthase subunit E family protein [Candidatus Bathyarchaeota archaeon]|nr:V-type ATP synthase subunit E family protein [Candidatus Bathyarchaeota archaeon]